MHDARPSQPRALGAATLSVKADAEGRTRLVDLRHSGSTKLVFPRIPRPDVEAILVNTAGGITGGDSFRLNIVAKARSTLSITTQAAERAYRAQSGETGRVVTAVSVHAGARVNWLPQELILFDRCALIRSLQVDLDRGAKFLMVEPMVFGRCAMLETLSDIQFWDRIRILRDGRPLYLDGIKLQGNAHRQLGRSAIANGGGALSSVVFVHPDAHTHLDPIRASLPKTAGASMLADDVLVIRHLAADGHELRCSLVPILERLTNNTLPISWRL